MSNEGRLPAVRLILKANVLNNYVNPFNIQKELKRCKNVDLSKIKFARIIKEASTLLIATDDPVTHAELDQQLPPDAFTSGVSSPKPKANPVKATAHHIPIDIQLNDPEVI